MRMERPGAMQSRSSFGRAKIDDAEKHKKGAPQYEVGAPHCEW